MRKYFFFFKLVQSSIMKTLLKITICSLVLFASCKKPGCMDKEATNYNMSANEDNGTCSYLGNVTFFSSDTLDNGPIKILVDNYDYGFVSSSASLINCGDSGGINVALHAGTHTYTCFENMTTPVLSGNLTILGKDCILIDIP